ncbi:hypothetical protein GXW82_31985 [Streptacidiphilus sp. 4-A2]|nr:hypothetical protein [Streptacidiphilus sp. 4-A2]
MFSSATPPADPMALGPQYSAFHVYVTPGQLAAFAKSWVGTFGGSYVKPFTTQLTPTAGSALATQVFSPVALLSVFDFTTPVPYPFGQERTGWGVANTDAATRQARSDGAASLVATFPDPIGRDSVIQFPGGIDTQLWHETTLSPNPSTPSSSPIWPSPRGGSSWTTRTPTAPRSTRPAPPTTASPSPRSTATRSSSPPPTDTSTTPSGTRSAASPCRIWPPP